MKTFVVTILSIIASVLAFGQSNIKFTSQSNSNFRKTITEKNIQLVDARTASEYAQGHIPGAVNMDVQSETFDKQSSKLDKSKPVAVYCRSGVRSKKAAKKLSSKGYLIYELDQGISKWDGNWTY